MDNAGIPGAPGAKLGEHALGDERVRSRRVLRRAIAGAAILVAASALASVHARAAEPAAGSRAAAPDPARSARSTLDPSARMLSGDTASESWTLFVDLDTGHRISQRFLITNAGPGDHNAVAVGHFAERGRAPFRYANGRRRDAWTLSADHRFLDIAASHLDLHRPKAALLITKDDIEIRLDFDFDAKVAAGRVPASQLPKRYCVELLAAAAPTRGTVKAPWMKSPLAVTGRTWLVHTWTPDDEAAVLDRRVDVFGRSGEALFYGLAVDGKRGFAGAWQLLSPVPKQGPAPKRAAKDRPRTGPSKPKRKLLDSPVEAIGRWQAGQGVLGPVSDRGFSIPDRMVMSGDRFSGEIRLSNEWLRFDPLDVIPQPFRWFIRRSSQPREVWADSQIAVSIGRALDPPSVPPSETERVSNSERESEDETTETSVTGVASITFMHPSNRP